MKHLFLIAILVLAAVVRIYQLGSFPVGLNADEAALGYNAYSLLLTGRDEHGHPWPVNLESFGDFKPALYAYILIPFVSLLGLTEFAIRLPSALFGIASVLLVYLFVRQLFNKPSALISALLLAISPWHIHFSRGAWEVNLSSTLILAGVWLFIRWSRSFRFVYLGLGLITFVLSMYAYQSSRVVAPLLGLGLSLVYVRDLLKRPRHLIYSIILLSISLAPLTFSILSTDAGSRLSGVGLLADIGPVNRINELRGQHSDPDSLIAKIFHNRPLQYSLLFISNYLVHFDGDFLFINGDPIARNKVPETGLLYLTDFIFIIFGVYYLLRQSNRAAWVIFTWILAAPVASALTFQVPHALRSQNLVMPLTILTALGAYQVFSFRPYRSLLTKLLIVLLVSLYSYQFARYLHQYYIHYPQTYPYAWQAGFRDLVAEVNRLAPQYDRIIVTDTYDQPYILFLFFSKYPPHLFQSDHTLSFRDRFNFSTVRSYANYQFTSINWSDLAKDPRQLIVADPDDLPQSGYNLLKTIYFPNGQPAFYVVTK